MGFAKRLLFIVFITGPTSLFAGTYFLNPTSYENSTTGLTVSETLTVTNTPNVDGSAQNFMYLPAIGSATDVTISGYTLKKGFTWSQVELQVAGTFTLTIRDSAGNTILGPVGVASGSDTVSTTVTYNLSQTEAAKQGRNLFVTLQFSNNTAKLLKLNVSYEGSGVYVFPSPYTTSEGNASIAYDLVNDASVTLQIYDSRGRLVKTIYKNQVVSARDSVKQTDSWNGRNDRGNKVASGIYVVFIKVKYLNSTNGFSGDYQDTFRFVVLR